MDHINFHIKIHLKLAPVLIPSLIPLYFESKIDLERIRKYNKNIHLKVDSPSSLSRIFLLKNYTSQIS